LNELSTFGYLKLVWFLRCKSYFFQTIPKPLIYLLYQKISWVVNPSQNTPTFKIQTRTNRIMDD